jgi:hypothetical protein
MSSRVGSSTFSIVCVLEGETGVFLVDTDALFDGDGAAVQAYIGTIEVRNTPQAVASDGETVG